MHQFNHTVHEIKQYAIKGTVPAPLTWIPHFKKNYSRVLP